MPERHGYKVDGGWASGSDNVNGNNVPQQLTIDHRDGDHPAEYKASSFVDLVTGFASGSGDTFLAYIANGSNTTAGNTGGSGGEYNVYRYGFNGKENDDEVKGEGNEQDYGMRIYDTRLGRFLSVDPMYRKYPELTPYQFAGNTPIQAIDVDGLEPKTHYQNYQFSQRYKLWKNFYEVNNNIQSDWSVLFMTDDDKKEYWVRFATVGGHPLDQYTIWQWAPADAKTSTAFKDFDPTGYSGETARDVCKSMKGADIALLKIFAGALAAPFVIEAGVVGAAELGTEMLTTKLGAAAADFIVQTVQNKGNVRKNNITGTLSALIFSSPLMGSAVASAGEFSLDEKFNKSIFEGKKVEEFGLETLFGFIGGQFGDKTTKAFIKEGKITNLGAQFLSSLYMNLVGTATGTVATEKAKEKAEDKKENKKEDKATND